MILKLQQDTFVRAFGVDDTANRNYQAPINFVQPNDGILMGYDQVEVSQKTVVGFDRSAIQVEMITTYQVDKYDDLSVLMWVSKIVIPRIEETRTRQAI